jgi:hypothetical protein
MRGFFLLILILLFTSFTLEAQNDSSFNPNRRTSDTVKPKPRNPQPVIAPKKDSLALADSIQIADSTRIAVADSIRTDSIKKITGSRLILQKDTSSFTLYLYNNLFLKAGKANTTLMIAKERLTTGKAWLFYLIAGVFMLLAILKSVFPKYIVTLFRLLKQSSFRQSQTRDILLQERLPSLLLNLLFFITGGLFISLILMNKGILSFRTKLSYACRYLCGKICVSAICRMDL